MFFKLLNSIRKKPEATRQLITLGASIAITCVIAGAWALSFIPEANSILGKTKAEDIIGPFSKISEKIPAAPSMDPQLLGPQAAATGADMLSTSTGTTNSGLGVSGNASSSAVIGNNATGTSTKNLLK